MNNESIAKLRVDRRLHTRRDWISKEDLQNELDALPDVSDKILEDREDETAAEASEAAEAPVPGAPTAPEGAGV
jgi:hypothetical protein